MILLSVLGILLLALYGFACTSTVVTMGSPEGYQDAQQWADELDASLCPMARAQALGLIPGAWDMPPRLALLLGLAPVVAHTPSHTRTKVRANRPTLTDMCMV